MMSAPHSAPTLDRRSGRSTGCDLGFYAKFAFDLIDAELQPSALVAVAAARTQCLQSFQFRLQRRPVIRISRERHIAQMHRLDGLSRLRAFHRESGYGVRAAREFDDIGIDRRSRLF